MRRVHTRYSAHGGLFGRYQNRPKPGTPFAQSCRISRIIKISVSQSRENHMAKKKAKRSNRGRKHDRALVAGGQDYEVGYEAKKTGKKRSAVRKAVKRVGNSRKRVTKAL